MSAHTTTTVTCDVCRSSEWNGDAPSRAVFHVERGGLITWAERRDWDVCSVECLKDLAAQLAAP